MDYESDARPDYDNGDDQTSTMEHDTSTVTNGNPLESDEKTQETDKPSQGISSKAKINLPLSKVRSIIKSDPDVSLAANETVYLMTKMTELFIGHIANRAYHYTKLGKRKTIQERDVMTCITANDELSFLEGIIDTGDS